MKSEFEEDDDGYTVTKVRHSGKPNDIASDLRAFKKKSFVLTVEFQDKRVNMKKLVVQADTTLGNVKSQLKNYADVKNLEKATFMFKEKILLFNYYIGPLVISYARYGISMQMVYLQGSYLI